MASRQPPKASAPRPKGYSVALSHAFCDHIASGDRVPEACEKLGVPLRTMRNWLVEHKDFADRYAVARKLQTDSLLDDARATLQSAIDSTGPPKLRELEARAAAHVIRATDALVRVLNPKDFAKVTVEIAQADEANLVRVIEHTAPFFEGRPNEFEQWFTGFLLAMFPQLAERCNGDFSSLLGALRQR